MVTFVAVRSALDAGCRHGLRGPLHDVGQCQDGGTRAWLLLTFGLVDTFGAYFLMIAGVWRQVGLRRMHRRRDVRTGERLVERGRVEDARVLAGRDHILGQGEAERVVRLRKELQNVTSPTIPTASAPLETADWSCGLMSAVPVFTGTTVSQRPPP